MSTQTLHRLNPSMKLLTVALTAITLTFILDPVTPTVLFVLTLAVGRGLGGLSVWRQLRPLLVFVIVGFAILVANILFNKHNAGAEALFWIGTVKVTGPALWAAGSLWMRLMCFALLSLVFVMTTPPRDLILSMVHQLRVNYRVAYGTMVGYRMLPLFRSDYETIQAAQRVRGVQDSRGIIHALRRFRRYAVPLLAGSVRKAGRVAIAMDARAFGAFPDRTFRVRMVVRRQDWVFLLAAIAVVAAAVVVLRTVGFSRFTWE